MPVYLTIEDLFEIAVEVAGADMAVRDFGLLEAAAARPAASAFGTEAYPDLQVKAAALLHSLVRNHALVDGNKRLAWAACLVFLGLNGQRVRGATEDERVEFVVSVASGELHELEKVADCLRGWSR
ncbi:MAG: death on curing protein [Pseudonocardiales bacterium]|nr:death on curing protein [Pseudonocardiales bacterium]